MAHDKMFGICENKCLVEVSPKTDTDAVEERVGTLEDEMDAVQTKNTEQDTAIAGKQDALTSDQAKVIDDSDLQNGYFINGGSANANHYWLQTKSGDSLYIRPGTNITFIQNATDDISINATNGDEARLTAIESKNTKQDSRITAVENVNTTQDASISALQTKIAELEELIGNMGSGVKMVVFDFDKTTWGSFTIEASEIGEYVASESSTVYASSPSPKSLGIGITSEINHSVVNNTLVEYSRVVTSSSVVTASDYAIRIKGQSISDSALNTLLDKVDIKGAIGTFTIRCNLKSMYSTSKDGVTIANVDYTIEDGVCTNRSVTKTNYTSIGYSADPDDMHFKFMLIPDASTISPF